MYLHKKQLLAIFAGISPAIIVNNKLIRTNIVACGTETVAFIATPDKAYIMLFIGIVSKSVLPFLAIKLFRLRLSAVSNFIDVLLFRQFSLLAFFLFQIK